MTKKEALKQFNSIYWSREFMNDKGRIDKDARVQAWNNYTDMLCKNKDITPAQYHNWTNPF